MQRRKLMTERVCAEPEGEIVVFLIGMRINKFHKPWKWLPVASAMPRMLKELAAHPELGLLHARLHVGLRNLMVLQYWKSAQHLQSYARSSGEAHLPAWQAFNRKIGNGGDVGIWHETYIVAEGRSESIYVNMPRYGLGLAANLLPPKGRQSSADGPIQKNRFQRRGFGGIEPRSGSLGRTTSAVRGPRFLGRPGCRRVGTS